MATNTAAWLDAPNAGLAVRPAPYTPPRPDELVVANRAVAVNPVDWIIQAVGRIAFRWIDLPTVVGTDLAGEVVEVGSAVTRFRVGDRVLAHAVGIDKDRNTAAEGAFQATTVVLERLAAAIPDDLPYERAAVLPLGMSTAACTLFEQDQMALRLPTTSSPTPAGQTVLVWGGSTSVGSNAIQLAVAAGYDVVTTCSPHNVGYVTALGAGRAFDHRSSTVVEELIDALRGTTVAGALAVATGTAAPCLRVLRSCEGPRFLSQASTPVSFASVADHPGDRVHLAGVLARVVGGTAGLQARCRLAGIRTKFVNGSALKASGVGPAIYSDFLPAALASGRYVAAPDPLVVGEGLEHVQAALDRQRRGVSAAKVVVTLPAWAGGD